MSDESKESKIDINDNEIAESDSNGTPIPPAFTSSGGIFDKFRLEYRPLDARSVFGVVDAVLKQPAQVVHSLIHSADPRIVLILLGMLFVCLAGIGMMMGAFSGGMQYWMVPLKVVVGTAIGALICLPSLYILVCLSGGAQSIGQVSRLLLMALALSGILLLGFMPVAWIFSEATESVVFMGVLYIIVWATGLFFGLRLMKASFQFLNTRSMGAIGFWVVIFSLVLLQMSTTLRPLIGTYEPLQFGEKQFFISHWISLAD